MKENCDETEERIRSGVCFPFGPDGGHCTCGFNGDEPAREKYLAEQEPVSKGYRLLFGDRTKSEEKEKR